MSAAVLFVMPWRPTGAGGVDRVVLNLISAFRSATDYRPLLMVQGNSRRVVERQYADLPLLYEFYLPTPFDERNAGRRLFAYLARLPVTLARLIQLIRRERIEVVNLHYPSLSVLTVCLARFLMLGSFRIVLSFHGTDVPTREGPPLVQCLWRFVLRRANAIVACSNALAGELRNFDAGMGDVVHPLHNAIDVAACQRTASEAPLPPGLDTRRYLLSVGKFEAKKGHEVLIESYERIAPHHPDLWLVIIGGSGPALPECRERVAASPFAERMLLYCDVPHESTLAAIARAEVFVLPSRREPFGIVILEAAALGVPVVASHVGGIPEIIESGASGVLVPPGDAAALAAALDGGLADPHGSRLRARRLQQLVSQRFNLASQVLAYRRIFETSRHHDVCARSRDAVDAESRQL